MTGQRNGGERVDHKGSTRAIRANVMEAEGYFRALKANIRELGRKPGDIGSYYAVSIQLNAVRDLINEACRTIRKMPKPKGRSSRENY